MFISLLVATFVISLVVSTLVVLLFRKPLVRILDRLLADPIHTAWANYLVFAVYVVGISSGVRIWELENYVEPVVRGDKTLPPPVLTNERWVLEVYRTVIGTLQGIAWLLLIFFIFALIGFVIIRVREMQK